MDRQTAVHKIEKILDHCGSNRMPSTHNSLAEWLYDLFQNEGLIPLDNCSGLVPGQLTFIDFDKSILDEFADDTLPPILGLCQHEWAMYQGLSESFAYCKHCGVKK